MIYRIDVRSRDGSADPVGASIANQMKELGLSAGSIQSARIFLLDTDANEHDLARIANELISDAIVETAEVASKPGSGDRNKSLIEVHLKPGVMDPVATSTEMAIRDMGLKVKEIRTGRAYQLDAKLEKKNLEIIASRLLANGVIENVYFERYIPAEFHSGHEDAFDLRTVAIRQLSDDQLRKLSREGHLFLSLTEMQAIQKYFLEQDRDPTDIELETLAQTWSEHCVHKTLKSAVNVHIVNDDGKRTGKRAYSNLIKETIFKATQEIMAEKQGFCLSVFKDNAGVIAFDETDAVCFKVETHNHPSAIEPYGGAATGAGGCIRDVMGTGRSAKPIANTDIFCVAYPFTSGVQHRGWVAPEPLPKGVIHPKRILQQVVAGVRDYGNRMGIPTVNGAVYFDNRYLGNPLVFCGCVGIIPRDKISKAALPGDVIVLMGGRTGRDGIHGATFSSAELTDTHADEFSHAVQIGNAITQKKMMDVILKARDRDLFTAITDLGAGGLSSAVGEMGEKVGANVHLETVPLKYAGLRYDEIWISEAQERMLLSVPKEHVDQLLKLSASEDVEATVIGTFGTEHRELILNYRGMQVGKLSMELLHEGIPMPTRDATVTEKPASLRWKGSPSVGMVRGSRSVREHLFTLIQHPNIASKHWIIRQYDHEVQGGSVVKPMTGPLQTGPSDASVLRPKLSSMKGVVLSNGLAPHIENPYQMAISAIDEAVRNAVAVGGDPDKLAILDNFCWPSVEDEETMGTLVSACEACYDASKALGIPFISGKDSLHNQFTIQETGQVLRIPNTLLISAMGVIEDVRKCITMDLKTPDNPLFLVRPRSGNRATLADMAATHRAMAIAISKLLVRSCHDVSDGGVLPAVAEMAIGSNHGAALLLREDRDFDTLFDEPLASYVIEIEKSRFAEASKYFATQPVSFEPLGRVIAEPKLVLATAKAIELEVEVSELRELWRGTLDW